jgi:hypothetical protein
MAKPKTFTLNIYEIPKLRACSPTNPDTSCRACVRGGK